MNKRKTITVIATVVGGVLAVAGLLVVAFMIFMGFAMANYGSNK